MVANDEVNDERRIQLFQLFSTALLKIYLLLISDFEVSYRNVNSDISIFKIIPIIVHFQFQYLYPSLIFKICKFNNIKV